MVVLLIKLVTRLLRFTRVSEESFQKVHLLRQLAKNCCLLSSTEHDNSMDDAKAILPDVAISCQFPEGNSGNGEISNELIRMLFLPFLLFLRNLRLTIEFRSYSLIVVDCVEFFIFSSNFHPSAVQVIFCRLVGAQLFCC